MTKKSVYAVLIAVLSVAILTFRPGIWLVDKPANRENEHYIRGWKDGCISGTNSYSLLYAPFMERPFVKEPDEVPAADSAPATPAAKAAKASYKSAWNEGFTLCRYYQSAVYELMQFAIVITTLLFIGYHLSRKRG